MGLVALTTVPHLTGKDVRCQRSLSAEALRDVKVNMRVKPDLTLPRASTMAAMAAAASPHIHITQAEVHKSPDPPLAASTDTNDPFADDADNILSKHQSLIVGSMEDLFSVTGGSSVRHFVIHEEESGSNSGLSTQERGAHTGAPTPPPRPRSRCLSDCSFVNDSKSSQHTEAAPAPGGATDGGPPPLPPKQYKGSRRKFKPLPAEPPESQDEGEDSSGRNTDSESIKQELNALTSHIAGLAHGSAYHN